MSAYVPPTKKMASYRVIFLVVLIGFLVPNPAIQTSEMEYGSGSADLQSCPMDEDCSNLPPACISCDFNYTCVYGQQTTANCSASESVLCQGNRNFLRNFTCRYCYQLPEDLMCCTPDTSCNVRSTPQGYYVSNCSASANELCLPPREFNKKVPCNYTTGKRWSTAFLLSFTVGGFGVDRFYLGHWRSALGKLFSFGGLGVWSILDVILVGTGYLTPEDGSSYIY